MPPVFRMTPERITTLAPNEVFVFGSNYAGRHGRGAAAAAMKFGAQHGVGTGPCGQTYAIATKDQNLRVLSRRDIETQLPRFFEYVNAHPEKTFLVTPIGCGLAKYSPKDIAPLFFEYHIPDNLVLPRSFWEYSKALQQPAKVR